MKLIIAGSRTIWMGFRDIESLLEDELNVDVDAITEIVCGGAKGMDTSGKEFAWRFSKECKMFPADWDMHGKAAGHIRNKQMAEYADALLLVWDGESKGSANMKKEMSKLKKPIFEVIKKKATQVVRGYWSDPLEGTFDSVKNRNARAEYAAELRSMSDEEFDAHMKKVEKE